MDSGGTGGGGQRNRSIVCTVPGSVSDPQIIGHIVRIRIIKRIRIHTEDVVLAARKQIY